MVRLRRRRRRACPGHDIEEVSMPPRAAKKPARKQWPKWRRRKRS